MRRSAKRVLQHLRTLYVLCRLQSWYCISDDEDLITNIVNMAIPIILDANFARGRCPKMAARRRDLGRCSSHHLLTMPRSCRHHWPVHVDPFSRLTWPNFDCTPCTLLPCQAYAGGAQGFFELPPFLFLRAPLLGSGAMTGGERIMSWFAHQHDMPWHECLALATYMPLQELGAPVLSLSPWSSFRGRGTFRVSHGGQTMYRLKSTGELV